MEKMITKKIKSPIPLYGIGLGWMIPCLVLDMTQFKSYIICFMISALTYLILEKIIPAKEITVTEPINLKDERANAFLHEASSYLVELKTLTKTIQKASLQQAILKTITAMEEILEYVVEHPKSASTLKKLNSYYLPTLIKLLNSYEEMESNRVQGENIKLSMDKIEMTMEKASVAFEKQLDLLYSNEKIDIISDIQVLETMMSQQGLTKENDYGRN